MAPRSKPKDPVEQLAHWVELLVRLKIDSIKGDRSQVEMIRFLAGFRLDTPEIVSLLNLPTTTVAPVVSKMRATGKNKTTKKKQKKRRA